MKGRDLTERLVSGEEVYAGGFFRVQRDVVGLPDGTTSVREYIRHPGAVGVVALLDDGRISDVKTIIGLLWAQGRVQ